MDPIQPGAICGERLRFERLLPNDAGGALWMATDLRTGTPCSVEFLEHSKPESDYIIPTRHVGLLSFYRFEIVESSVTAVSAYHPLLEAPSLRSLDLATLQPSVALSWFTATAEAIAAVHETGQRPHGAIVPSRIRASATSALVTGYPYAAIAADAPERAFSSPQRRERDAGPSISDDIFSLAAVGYFMLSGGREPPIRGAGLSQQEPDIDSLRRERGLAPTGWPAGWDRPLQAGLAALPSLRPVSARALIREISAVVGEVRDSGSRRDIVRPLRQPRRSSRYVFGSLDRHSRPVVAAEPPQTDRSVQRIAAQWAEAERLREDLSRQQALLAADVIQIDAAKADAERVTAELRSQRATLDEAEKQLETLRAELNRGRAALEKDKNEFEVSKIARLEQRKQELERATRELAHEHSLVEAERRGLAVQQAAMNERASALKVMEREVARRQDELREMQRAWMELSGSADPEAWKALLAKARAAEESKQPIPVDSPPPQPSTAALVFRSGRRLHVYSGRVIRFGRHAQSDFVLLPFIRGPHQPSVIREISRKHFELRIESSQLWVRDGWSDEDKPSQHGVFIDGRRVPAGGTDVPDGAILSVTTRPPSRFVPHWKVTLLTSENRSVGRGESTTAGFARAESRLAAVYLHRLDEAPGDICILVHRAVLKEMGIDDGEYRDAILSAVRGGILWTLNGKECLLTNGATPYPGVTVVSSPWLAPSRGEPAVDGTSTG